MTTSVNLIFTINIRNDTMQFSKDYLIACCRSGTISWDGVGWISKQALQRRIEFDLICDIGDDEDCDDYDGKYCQSIC